MVNTMFFSIAKSLTRHQQNGAVIARCSQPEIGWFGWRSDQDEHFIESILRACKTDNPQTTVEDIERPANGTAGGEANGKSVCNPFSSVVFI